MTTFEEAQQALIVPTVIPREDGETLLEYLDRLEGLARHRTAYEVEMLEAQLRLGRAVAADLQLARYSALISADLAGARVVIEGGEAPETGGVENPQPVASGEAEPEPEPLPEANPVTEQVAEPVSEPTADPALSTHRQQLLAYIAAHPGCTSGELKINTGVPMRALGPALNKLVSDGSVARAGAERPFQHFICGTEPVLNPDKLTPRQALRAQVLELLAAHPNLLASEITERLNANKQVVATSLNVMVSQGLIEQRGVRTRFLFALPGAPMPAEVKVERTHNEMILEYIAAHPGCTSGEIVQGTDVPKRSVYPAVSHLVNGQTIARVGDEGAYRYYMMGSVPSEAPAEVQPEPVVEPVPEPTPLVLAEQEPRPALAEPDARKWLKLDQRLILEHLEAHGAMRVKLLASQLNIALSRIDRAVPTLLELHLIEDRSGFLTPTAEAVA